MPKGCIIPFLLSSWVDLINSNKAVRSPAFVLLDDDPCLRDSGSEQFQCGTALLQSGNRRLPPRKAGHQAASSKFGENEAGALLASLLEVAEKASHNASLMVQLRHLAVVSDTAAAHSGLRTLQQEHAARMSSCDLELRLRQDNELKITSLYNQWQQLHKACQTDELALRREVESCLQFQTADKRQNDTADCRKQDRLLKNKMEECSSVRIAMRSTGCARASQAAESCGAYGLCRSRLSAAFLHAATVAKVAHSGEQHKVRWVATATSKCLQDRLSDVTFKHSDSLLAAKECRALAEKEVQSTGHQIQDLPPPLECNKRSGEQALCAEEAAASAGSQHQALPDFSARALGADLAREVSAVSFMQEGIERADALPGHLHKVFTDFMLSIPMLLAMLTLLMLWARCTVAFQSREQKDLLTPSSVDAWCVQGQANPDAESDGKWLCHELIVPRNSRCAVTVPRMLKEGPWTALVSDKMGQCMFKACSAEAAQGLQINLLRQDGAVLAACQISFEGEGSCQILRGNDETPFASLEWEAYQARASWFRWKAAGPGSFVLRSKLGVLLQVTGSLDGEDGRLHVHDDRQRPVADATLCRGGGGSSADTLHVQVVSAAATDLSLVLGALLAVDRLQAFKTFA